jgi:hypothetical protein
MQASSLPDEQTLVRLVVAKRQSTVARFSQVSADGAVFMNRVQLVGITGQSLPDPLRRRGASVKTTHDHSAQ